MRLARKPATRYCPLLLEPRQAKASHDPHWLWCASGRGGLELACAALGLREGHAVLLPEYICDVVLHPIQRLGLRPVWYALESDLSPNWQNLSARLPEVQAAMLMHPFGQPQDARRFAGYCRNADVLFLEDNAHGYGATLQGRPLGTWGDAGVTSPWKQYPIPCGAGLWFQDIRVAELAHRLSAHWPIAHLPVVKPWCKSRLREALTLVPLLRRAFLAPPSAEMEGPEDPQVPCMAQASIIAALERVQAVSDAARRRQIYAEWSRWLEHSDLTPIFTSLHPEAAPLCFPAYAADVEARQRWLRWGWLHDVAVHTWPTLPAQLRNLPVVTDRWQRLLCFPIHQEMDPQFLRQQLDRLPPPC